jgi:CheY-like chemotaxis protein
MESATVLLADDEAHITCVVAGKLRGAGYTVITARDGEEALELARRHTPALVITDLQMPRMSGVELARALRASPGLARTPVILLTARGYIAEADDIARTNIIRQMAKPFSAREIVRTVQELIDPADSGVTVAPTQREAA